ncbi:MAG: hypothetical protein EOO88_35810 [Pedobacter sp.]|nr:MAG: hypothetical protein EOO88_35810 [Pedobacter sp.]
MITDNYGTNDREDRSYRTADQGINSETMEKKDPAVNQHQDDTSIRGHYSDKADNFERKNSSSQDFDDEFTASDRDRRTLDESEAEEEEELMMRRGVHLAGRIRTRAYSRSGQASHRWASGFTKPEF